MRVESSPQVDASHLAAWAVARIEAVCRSLWPVADVAMETHLPSVTNYVHLVRVTDGKDTRLVCAKYDFGASLTSIIRGARGDTHAVLAAQDARSGTRPAGQLEHDRAQAAALAALGIATPPVLALRDGVLITGYAAHEHTLATRVLAVPGETGPLLDRVWTALARLHGTAAAKQLRGSAALGASVTGVHANFMRKFNAPHGRPYLASLGRGWLGDTERRAARRAFVRVVSRIRDSAPVHTTARVVYGDLKPEHVLVPADAADTLVFIDPGLQWTSPIADVAKLLSRTVQLLVAHDATASDIETALGALLSWAMVRLDDAGSEAGAWRRELLRLWAMDTVNILSTYLSLPQGALSLSPTARRTAERSTRVLAVADVVGAALAHDHPPLNLFDRLFQEVAACIGPR